MQITAIEPQKRNPRRVNIYLEGAFAFSLARIVAAWLKVGQDLSQEKIAALQAEDEQESTYQRAVHFLSFRPRSTAEMRQNLKARKVPEALMERTLARLQENGLLDDEAFARLWVENRNEFRPRSRSALRMELQRKGLPHEIIQNVLDADVDEPALAERAARKYSRKLQGLDWPEFRLKLGGFLARRGFSYSTITPLVTELWQEISQGAAAGGPSKDEERI